MSVNFIFWSAATFNLHWYLKCKKKVDVQQGYWNKFTIFHTIGNNIIAEIICYNTLRRLESGKEIPYTLCRLSRSAFPLQYDDDA
jgi:hypothetical protein